MRKAWKGHHLRAFVASCELFLNQAETLAYFMFIHDSCHTLRKDRQCAANSGQHAHPKSNPLFSSAPLRLCVTFLFFLNCMA